MEWGKGEGSEGKGLPALTIVRVDLLVMICIVVGSIDLEWICSVEVVEGGVFLCCIFFSHGLK